MSFVIEDFAPVAKVNPYAEAVQALAQALAQAGAGEGKALTITTEKGQKRDGTPGDGQKDRLLFQKAANEAGFTARAVRSVDNEDGTVSQTFILVPLHKRGRNKSEDAETPAETPAESEPIGEAPEVASEPVEAAEGDASERSNRRRR